METDSILKFEKVNFSYSKNKDFPMLLSDVKLNLSSGEIVSVCGKNGSGKSTILNLIAGFIEPLSGKITRTKSEGEVFGAMVFQEIGLLEWKNVFDNVALGVLAKNISKEEKEKIVLENLELLGIKDCNNKFPKELSGGIKQRVVIARALVSSPKVLLLDEPFSALDWNVKSTLIKDLRRVLKSKKIAAVFVTHSPDDAIMFSDRIFSLKEGNLVLIGSNIKNKNVNSRKFFSLRSKLVKSII